MATQIKKEGEYITKRTLMNFWINLNFDLYLELVLLKRLIFQPCIISFPSLNYRLTEIITNIFMHKNRTHLIYYHTAYFDTGYQKVKNATQR